MYKNIFNNLDFGPPKGTNLTNKKTEDHIKKLHNIYGNCLSSKI